MYAINAATKNVTAISELCAKAGMAFEGSVVQIAGESRWTLAKRVGWETTASHRHFSFLVFDL